MKLEPSAQSILRKGLNSVVTSEKSPVEDIIIMTTEEAYKQLWHTQADTLSNQLWQKQSNMPKNEM